MPSFFEGILYVRKNLYVMLQKRHRLKSSIDGINTGTERIRNGVPSCTLCSKAQKGHTGNASISLETVRLKVLNDAIFRHLLSFNKKVYN